MKFRLIISFFLVPYIFIYTVYVVYIKHICICTYFSHVLTLGRDVETIDSYYRCFRAPGRPFKWSLRLLATCEPGTQ